VWGRSWEDLHKRYPETVAAPGDYTAVGRIAPKSVTFIPASVYDNPKLLEKDPGYLANLMALPETERKRLLGDRERGGNWHVRPGGTKFQKHWFEIVESVPADMREVRFWDLAATEQKNGHDPDWTAGCRMGEKDGVFYITDVRHDRLSPKNTEDLVRNTGLLDGYEVPIRMEKEPGASGKIVIDHYARIVLSGFDFMGLPPRGSKEIRANPLSAAAEAGNVKLLRGAWNRAFLDEVESFSPECKHDDQTDSASGAHTYLTRDSIAASVSGAASPVDARSAARFQKQIEEIMAGITDEDERLEALHLLHTEGML
jgi:predicted phage terminase large subunit-like protein